MAGLCFIVLVNFVAVFAHLLAPAAAIALTMLSFNFLGDGLRDALDPGMKDR